MEIFLWDLLNWLDLFSYDWYVALKRFYQYDPFVHKSLKLWLSLGTGQVLTLAIFNNFLPKDVHLLFIFSFLAKEIAVVYLCSHVRILIMYRQQGMVSAWRFKNYLILREKLALVFMEGLIWGEQLCI